MSHSLDFGSVWEKLFLLRQLALGSRSYARDGHLVAYSDWADEDWEEYEGQLKRLVSSYLIEVAIKTRIFQDSAQVVARPFLFKAADVQAREGLDIGSVMGGVKLSVRESCNKIVHATTVNLVWKQGRVNKPYRRYTYWAGDLALSGAKGAVPWDVQLKIANWSIAVEAFLQYLWSEVDPDGLGLEQRE